MSKYFDKKEENIKIFKRLCKVVSEDDYIQKDIEDSVKDSRIYSKELGDFNPHNMEHFECIKFDDMEDVCDTTEVRFMKTNTIDAAIDLLRNDLPDKICILNFASAKKPGGMVLNGSNAQEECLCRSTTLYHVLSNKVFYKPYYKFHKNNTDNFYSSTLIYSPNVNIIFDGSYNPIEYHDEYEPFYTDVITSPFPNLRNFGWWSVCPLKNPSKETIEALVALHKIYIERIDNIFRAAIDNHVDCFVVGAWGCGVFMNYPSYVATVYKEIVRKYDKKIPLVVFAIPDLPTFSTFKGIFNDERI